jgi:hypothetical protein
VSNILDKSVALSADPMEVVVDQSAPVGDEVSKLANQFSLPEDYDITVRHPDTKEGMLHNSCFDSPIYKLFSNSTFPRVDICGTGCC